MASTGQGREWDRRHRLRTCPGGFRSARCRWRRPAIPSLRRSATGRLRAWAEQRCGGAAAAVAAAAGSIRDVLRGSRRGGSRRRGRLGGAELVDGLAEPGEFAAGSACAFSTLSRRSLALLNWPVVVLELCSRPAFSATISASIRATEASSALSFADAWVERPISGHQLSDARGCQRATQRTCHRRQRHHGGHRADPALAGRCLRRRSLGSAPTRSPGDMIITLPGKRGASGFTASILGASALGASAFGASTLAASTLRRPPSARRASARSLPARARACRLDLGRGCYRLIRRRTCQERPARRRGFRFHRWWAGVADRSRWILQNWLTIW